jgi:hypothetical protein
MTRRSIPLVERLSHGLASAVLSAAALAAPAAEAASPAEPRLAQSQGGASRPAARSAAIATPKTTGAQRPPSAKTKPSGGSKGSAPAGGCGASEGGCGPSR